MNTFIWILVLLIFTAVCTLIACTDEIKQGKWKVVFNAVLGSVVMVSILIAANHYGAFGRSA